MEHIKTICQQIDNQQVTSKTKPLARIQFLQDSYLLDYQRITKRSCKDYFGLFDGQKEQIPVLRRAFPYFFQQAALFGIERIFGNTRQ